jgi:hypothetical protein
MLSLNGQNSDSVLPEEGFAIFKNVWLEQS